MLGLTRAHSKSTASSMSSWWPILDTPKSSSSWWVIRSSWSPPTFSLSKVLMYCWRQSSKPGETTHTHTHTGRAENFQYSLTRWTFLFIYLFFFLAENFLLSCENHICIMCSDELSSPGYVLRKVWAQVVFCWVRGVKRPVSDRKSDRFALVNGPAVHFSAFKQEQGFGSKEGLFVSARLVLHLSPLLQVWRLLMKQLMKCSKKKQKKNINPADSVGIKRHLKLESILPLAWIKLGPAYRNSIMKPFDTRVDM